MWSAMWSAIKGIAVAVGWAKQAADQNTGRKLQRAEDTEKTVETTAAINSARNDPDNLRSVRDRSSRD